MMCPKNDAAVTIDFGATGAQQFDAQRPWIATLFFSAIIFASITSTVFSSEASTTSEPPPNFLLVLVDDLGWSDVGYQHPATPYETPNVDRLASQGMRFTGFYAAGPVCSPTRASILTGKYPPRTGITTFLISPSRDPAHVAHHLALSEHTLGEAFQDHGYSTGYFGKWHLGYETKHWASQQGFSVALGGMDLPWAWQLAHPDRTAPPLDRAKGHTRFFSPHHLTHLENGPESEYLTDRLTNETIGFIERSVDQPFFAFLSFHTVHTPLQAKPEVVAQYDKKIKKMGLDQRSEPDKREKHFQNNPDYAAMVHHMDENVGRLLRTLDTLKLSDRTIVVFTSDNGGKGSVTSNLPLRGMKHNLYEGGIRVPMLVRWPGTIEAGSRCAHPLISNDLYPTMLDLAGLPLEPRQHLDGVSFKPILLGEDCNVDRQALYWHYPHNRNEGAVRMGDYKLLYQYTTGQTQLYHLATDIGETRDLSAEKPQLAHRMVQMLKNWHRDVDAQFAKRQP